METKRQTKKTAFCCPHHGVLLGPVEYFSKDMGSKQLVDVPVIYCQECKKYYTPFTNLLALVRPQYKGRRIAAAQGNVKKSIPKVEVRTPYFIDVEEEKKRKEQIRLEKAENRKKYIEGLREVCHDQIILTNKSCFIKERRCPHCNEITKKEHVKITQHRKYILANIRHCNYCNADYITPVQFENINEKAGEIIRGYYQSPFVSPIGVSCEYQIANANYLFIPEWALDFSIYDHRHLPPLGDDFYDMTAEEYLWVKMYYQPEEFTAQLKTKSFLSEAGYSTSESEIRRHKILAKCVNEYGKSRVISQLKFNINVRMKQKDGNQRYERALNIWRGDISYVENKL